MTERPLLLFPTPTSADRMKLHSGPHSIHRPAHGRQGERNYGRKVERNLVRNVERNLGQHLERNQGEGGRTT